MITALLILACLSLFYVVGPLLMMLEVEAPPHTRRVTTAEAPKQVAAAVSGWKKAFGDAAFSLVSVQQISSGLAPVAGRWPPAGHVLHLVDRAAGMHGLDYVTSAGRWQVLLTGFDDGEEVVTTNYQRPLTLAPHPRVHVARLPGVRNLARLRALHAAHLAQTAGARQLPLIPGDENLGDFVAEHERRTLERQCELGAKQRRGDGEYRPTLRGAFRSVWSLLPPLRWTNAIREHRRTRMLRDAVR